MAKKLVVFLHGFGSNGQDLLGLAQLWRAQLPGVEFASPNAPFVSDAGFGYQWFSLAGISEGSRAERVVQARQALDSTLSDILAKHQFVSGQDQLVLVGFSQGSIMALDALVSGRLPLAGVVAFSGRLASPAPWVTSNAPALLLHGREDAVIPWQNSAQAAEALRAAGFNAHADIEAGLEHSISQAGANQAAAFIANCFA